MSKIAAIIGRILIGLLFIVTGISKLMDVAGTETMITGVGLPHGLAIPTGAFELIAGLLLALGFATRIVSVLLALFTAATILFFHNRFTDPQQAINALKNLAIIGGLALAFAHSHMWWHYYAMRERREGEVAARSAEQRVHEAELRAARAEATAEALRTGTPAPVYADETGHVVQDTGVVRRRRWFDW
jgi:putative oxidoreductase